jgi:hypothetical protein
MVTPLGGPKGKAHAAIVPAAAISMKGIAFALIRMCFGMNLTECECAAQLARCKKLVKMTGDHLP